MVWLSIIMVIIQIVGPLFGWWMKPLLEKAASELPEIGEGREELRPEEMEMLIDRATMKLPMRKIFKRNLLQRLKRLCVTKVSEISKAATIPGATVEITEQDAELFNE